MEEKTPNTQTCSEFNFYTYIENSNENTLTLAVGSHLLIQFSNNDFNVYNHNGLCGKLYLEDETHKRLYDCSVATSYYAYVVGMSNSPRVVRVQVRAYSE